MVFTTFGPPFWMRSRLFAWGDARFVASTPVPAPIPAEMEAPLRPLSLGYPAIGSDTMAEGTIRH